jgi:hypothetical protein
MEAVWNGTYIRCPLVSISEVMACIASDRKRGENRIPGRPEQVASADDAPFAVEQRAGSAGITRFLAGRVE